MPVLATEPVQLTAGAATPLILMRQAHDTVHDAPELTCAALVQPAGQVCVALFFVATMPISKLPTARPAGSAGVIEVPLAAAANVPTAPNATAIAYSVFCAPTPPLMCGAKVVG